MREYFSFQVIVVTLAFAICWLPIHVLELLKCANTPLLHRLITSYPKVLYSIRAFTHALAYFNSCFNPFLYALLNRNFCLDLADVISSFRTCCQQADAQKTENGNYNSGRTSCVKSVEKHRASQSRPDDEEEENESRRKLIETPIKDTDGPVQSLQSDPTAVEISVISH